MCALVVIFGWLAIQVTAYLGILLVAIFWEGGEGGGGAGKGEKKEGEEEKRKKNRGVDIYISTGQKKKKKNLVLLGLYITILVPDFLCELTVKNKPGFFDSIKEVKFGQSMCCCY